MKEVGAVSLAPHGFRSCLWGPPHLVPLRTWRCGVSSGPCLYAREPSRSTVPFDQTPAARFISDYLWLEATSICGLPNRDSSSFGFTSTLSMLIFSGGTGIALTFVPVFTGRTLVSKVNGIWSPLTDR